MLKAHDEGQLLHDSCDELRAVVTDDTTAGPGRSFTEE